jgi:hypothetical protein
VLRCCFGCVRAYGSRWALRSETQLTAAKPRQRQQAERHLNSATLKQRYRRSNPVRVMQRPLFHWRSAPARSMRR